MLGGAVVLAAGAMVLLSAVVFGLAEVMPLWLSALIVGAIVAVIGAVMVVGGKKKLQVENLKPHRVIEEARADKQFVKARVS